MQAMRDDKNRVSEVPTTAMPPKGGEDGWRCAVRSLWGGALLALVLASGPTQAAEAAQAAESDEVTLARLEAQHEVLEAHHAVLEGEHAVLEGKIDSNFALNGERIDALSAKDDHHFELLSERIDSNFETLNGRIDMVLWVLAAGFGFLGLVTVLFWRERPTRQDLQAAEEAVEKAVEKTVEKAVEKTVEKAVQQAVQQAVDQAVQRALAQQGGRRYATGAEEAPYDVVAEPQAGASGQRGGADS